MVTRRQSQVLAIVRAGAAKGCAPSFRDIANILGITSLNGVAGHLKALKEKGLIEWDPGLGRTLRPTRKKRKPGLPIAGIVKGEKVSWIADNRRCRNPHQLRVVGNQASQGAAVRA